MPVKDGVMKLFSIVIPAHNEEKVIGKCLDCVIGQKKRDIEIVVVNDGSSDNTKEIVEKYARKCSKIKLINFSRGHSAAFARNAGAKIAMGGYLIFIDADQLAEKDFTERIEKFLEKNPEIDGSDYLVLSYKPETIFQKAWSAYRKCYPSIGLVHIIRKNVFDKLRGFDEKVFYFEDTEFRDRFLKQNYVFKGPISAEVHHIEPEGWKDFVRQRKWQGRQASLKYFLPCVFPPLMLIQFFKIWRKSNDFKNTVYWIVLDLIGRYVSIVERIKS